MNATTAKSAIEYTQGFAHGQLHARAKTPLTWHPRSMAYNTGASDGYYIEKLAQNLDKGIK